MVRACNTQGCNACSIMVGHRYWMPPPRHFQPMFQAFISNQLLCYIQSL